MKLIGLILVVLVSSLHGEELDSKDLNIPVDRDGRSIFRYAFPIHVVPTMANSPGRFGAYFKTRVVIYNPTDFQYTIYATLYGKNGEIDTRSIEMDSDFFWVWDNFLEQVFGYRGTGAVEFDAWFDPPGGSSDFDFTVQAEVYTDSPNGRYSTLVVNGEGAEDFRLGTSTVLEDGQIAINPGLSSTSDQRVNVGIFNDDRSRKTFVAFVVNQGEIVQTIEFDVPGKGWSQKAVTAKFETGAIGWGCLQEYCSGYPWVVTVNNKSNDGVLIQPMTYDPPENSASSSSKTHRLLRQQLWQIRDIRSPK
ncbi:MAG: hypothetical protein OXI69_15290 [Acidobacteriota bacterium]|nr:hypothetical protein [Acidobacteriota bacterium]